ncbi:MAG: hypothetical protein DMF24_09930 [Verrucomicrobia bacterium]|nr:MAG: hypothetical protein DME90_02700 [Verrucomicrobiota bacterium]PYL60501.1 MAG: hypothetical protein DMF24_09930 [Verrucomicrobiota bacterium]
MFVRYFPQVGCARPFQKPQLISSRAPINFSRNAQFNAENILFIESAPLADAYSAYIIIS